MKWREKRTCHILSSIGSFILIITRLACVRVLMRTNKLHGQKRTTNPTARICISCVVAGCLHAETYNWYMGNCTRSEYEELWFGGEGHPFFPQQYGWLNNCFPSSNRMWGIQTRDKIPPCESLHYFSEIPWIIDMKIYSDVQRCCYSHALA